MSLRVVACVFTVTFGSLLALLGYLFGIVPLLALGISALILGIMALYLPESGKIPAYIATSIGLPALVNLERLLEELYLDEKGIYIPTNDPDLAPKVFIPLAQTQLTKHPSMEMARRGRLFVTVGEGPGERGILLDAPGSEILSQVEKLPGVGLAEANMDDLGSTLSAGFKALGVAEDLTIQRQDDTVNVSLNLLALLDLESKMQTVTPRLASQIGGPLESAVAAAVANVTRSYVLIKRTEFDPSKKKVTIVLELRKLTAGLGGSKVGE